MSDNKGRKLADLRVVDLREELEKRDLDKTGNKQVLLERLQKALKEENVDSDNHTFDSMEGDAKDTSLNGSESKDNSQIEMDIKSVEEKEVTALEKSHTVNSDMKKREDIEGVHPVVKEDAHTPEEQKQENKEEEHSDNRQTNSESPEDKTKEEALIEEADRKIKKFEESSGDSPTSADKSAANPEGDSNCKKSEDQKENKTSDGKENQGKCSDGKSTTPHLSRKEKFTSDQNRNLWITNISQTTRATELKQALSEHGKVVGAKVVINARHPAACCYGYVKMETVADADNCIAKLNNTELNGQIIRIEKVRPDHLNPLKKTESKEKDKSSKTSQSGKSDTPKDEKKENKEDKKELKVEKTKEDKSEKVEDNVEPTNRVTNNSKSAERKSRERKALSKSRTERSLSSKSGSRKDKERELLTFDKIKDERERERLRERERILRDRRREEIARQREIERHQRSESVRLEREREKLRRERERLERERAEFMQFERERQKIEREKLELERIELERAKIRMQEEERRAVKRTAPASYRERSYEDRKRVPNERHFEEAPPPPRFDPPTSIKTRDTTPPIKKFSATSSSTGKEYNKPRLSYEKRDQYPPKRDYEDRSHPSSISRPPQVPKYDNNSSYSNRDRDDMRDPRVREPTGMSSVSNSKYPESKVTRYNDRERDRSPHFRSGMRDERDSRRPVPDSKSEIRNTRNDHRYPDSQKDSVRYERTSSSNANWNPQKVFSSSSTNKQWGGKEGWRSDNPNTNDRWSTSNAPRGSTGMSSGFSGNTNMNMGPSCPPPPGINNYVNDRFEYKGNMGSMRKY